MAILSKPSIKTKILEFFPLGLNDLVSSPRFHRTQVAKKYDEGAGGCPTCTHKHSEKEFHLASARLLLASPQSWEIPVVFFLNYYRKRGGGIRLWHPSCIPKGFATQIAHCCMEVSYTIGFCTSGENRCAKNNPFFGLRRSFGQIAREKEMLLEGEEKCIEAIERKKRIQSSILYVPTDTDVSHASSASSLPNRPCCVHVLLSFSLGAQELTSQQ